MIVPFKPNEFYLKPNDCCVQPVVRIISFPAADMGALSQ